MKMGAKTKVSHVVNASIITFPFGLQDVICLYANVSATSSESSRIFTFYLPICLNGT